jgi:hypothetical protein
MPGAPGRIETQAALLRREIATDIAMKEALANACVALDPKKRNLSHSRGSLACSIKELEFAKRLFGSGSLSLASQLKPVVELQREPAVPGGQRNAPAFHLREDAVSGAIAVWRSTSLLTHANISRKTIPMIPGIVHRDALLSFSCTGVLQEWPRRMDNAGAVRRCHDQNRFRTVTHDNRKLPSPFLTDKPLR